jgi:hypothetical protein
MCHKKYISIPNHKGILNVPDAISEFGDWFYDVLFKSKDNSIPIFGDAPSKDGKFKKADFAPVQIYLINEYFIPKDSHYKVIQVSLALICYWYQNFHPICFFEREQEYWKNMIESLGKMLNYYKQNRLKCFDSEGNWIGS